MFTRSGVAFSAFVVVVGCRKEPEAADASPSPSPAAGARGEGETTAGREGDAKPAHDADGDAAPALPAEMPPASGELGGRSFTPRKGVFRRRGGKYDSLDFWDTATGARCEHQLAPDGALYLSLSPRVARKPWPLGTVMSQTSVLAAYPSEGYGLEQSLAFVVDVIDERAGVVRGRLRLMAPDDTAYAGAFEAAWCPDGVTARDTGGEVAGVHWGQPPAAAELPDTAVAADLGGRPTAIVRAAAGRLPDFEGSPLFVDLFTKEPPAPCALHIGAGAGTPGFFFALGEHPRPGDVLEYHGTAERDAVPPVYAKLNIRMSDADPVQSHGDGDAVVIVDTIGRSRVRGRVYAAFRDPGKSLLVGRFDAPICAESDVQ